MLRSAHLVYAACFLLTATLVASSQDLVPNVDKVPNPCQSNLTWPGVGYRDIAGRGGERNAFGADFDRHGKAWSAVCRLDSDGDGRTNGQELGDPDCTWTPGTQARVLTGITHPGVCDPLSSEDCKRRNTWLHCEPFSCPAFNVRTTLHKDLQFTRTQIPTDSKDSYYCMAFQLPADKNYHIIGTRPIINSNLVHDIMLYGCDAGFDSSPIGQLKPCFGGLSTYCRSPIGAWGVGEQGQCFPDAYGLPMGQNGYKYAVVQIHWHNAGLVSGVEDNSGLVLYYTSQLRDNTAQILRIGQRFLELPERRDSVTASGNCMHQCTSKMPHSVRIASAVLRMNSLGRSGDIKQYRGGSPTKTLINDQNYNFTYPNIVNFNETIEFRPGDELRVNCVYRTTDKISSTSRGDLQSDEICVGFIAIYPAISEFDYCVQWKDLPYCKLDSRLSFQNCDIDTFDTLLPEVERYCNSSCTNVCKVMVGGLQNTGCNRGTVGQFIAEFHAKPKNVYRDRLLPLISTCLQTLPESARGPPAAAAALTVCSLQLMLAVCVAQALRCLMAA